MSSATVRITAPIRSMRGLLRVLPVLASVGLLALAPNSLVAAAPKKDLVVGSGVVTMNVGFEVRAQAQVSAHSGPSGQDPTGMINLRGWYIPESEPLTGGAEVTCVAVAGNAATVWGRLKKPVPFTGPFGSGTYQNVRLDIIDRGRPKENNDLFDVNLTGAGTGITIPPVTTCSPPSGSVFTAEHGNFTVTDAQS